MTELDEKRKVKSYYDWLIFKGSHWEMLLNR